MKRTIMAIAVNMSTLLAAPAFAGNEGAAGTRQMDDNLPEVVVLKTSHCESKGANLPSAEKIALLQSCLAEASSPANVKAAALQEKKAYCNNNAKNKTLRGDEKQGYLTACMNNNEALAQFEQVNQGMASLNTEIASMDFKNALRQLTGLISDFWRGSPDTSQ